MGQILILKGADFSANAVSADVLYDNVYSQTVGTHQLGVSDAYMINHRFDRPCVITAIKCKPTKDFGRTKYGTMLIVAEPGTDAVIRSAALPPIDQSKQDWQLLQLAEPLRIDVGQYFGYDQNRDVMVNPDATAGDADVAYAIDRSLGKGSTADGVLMTWSNFIANNLIGLNNYVGLQELYGYYTD